LKRQVDEEEEGVWGVAYPAKARGLAGGWHHSTLGLRVIKKRRRR